MIRVLRLYCFVVFVIGYASEVSAQEYTGAEKHLWKPISPAPDSVIANGNDGIYIRVAFSKDYSLDASSMRIFVDNQMIDGNVKALANNVFTTIYTKPLKPGKHLVEAEVVSTTGYLFEPFKWSFYIKFPNQDSFAVAKDTFRVYGNIMAETRITNLSGAGSSLRQEPPHTSQFGGDLRVQNSQWNFGLRGFYTSDEYLYGRNFQSRNYVQANIGWRGIQLTAGDINPVFDRLVMTGTRVKGAMLALKYKHIELKLLRGLLAREVEGQLYRLGANEPAPPNLQTDSTYMMPGTYKRTVSAARLQFRTFSEGSYLGFTVMRAKDVVNSIKYGVAPKDNVVIGVDQTITGYDQRVKFSYGVAMSGFTNDISKGAISKAEIDSVLGDPNNPYDPQKYTSILIINESTIIPSNRSITSYINTTFKLGRHHQFFVENKKFGSAYISMANPFVRADQRSWEFQDRFNFFKRAVSGYLRYQYLQNNLSKTSFTTLFTNIYAGMLTIKPNDKWPSLIISAMQQQRRSSVTGREVSVYFLNNDDVITYTAALSHTFKTGTIKNTINLNLVQSNRKDITNPLNNNTTQLYSASLQQTFSVPLTLNYQYSMSRIELVSSNYGSLTSTYGTWGQYKFAKQGLEVGAGYFANRVGASQYSVASVRPLMRVFATYRGFKKSLKPLVLYVEAATAPYTEQGNPINNYTETYMFIRANYILGY
ncbi:MAG: hypothetical protein F9K23_16200 [Bacteroidetes bacterium]|nr:MAG: hypothetical protein F9K23_16200 [Bacteroidota bacterium]